METKHYAGQEEKATLNNQNPYAGIQQPTGYGAQPQTTTVVTQSYSSPPLPITPNLPPQLRARALYAFAGSSAAELSFNIGEILTIVGQDGAWWTAESNGKRGYIPSNYVELI